MKTPIHEAVSNVTVIVCGSDVSKPGIIGSVMNMTRPHRNDMVSAKL